MRRAERLLPAPVTSRHVVGLDGLRGIAVAAVVGYHLRPAWFPGGFLGVDLFFVLSGYLITGILLRETDQTGRIDFVEFLSRRLRRLLPAVITVVVAVVAFASAAGFPGQLAEVRRYGLATLGYVANWVFIADGSSYFTDIAGPSMLKHVWSLAIEEQFYLFWPALLLVLFRVRGRTAVALGAGAIAVASAGWMALLYDSADPSRAYFGTDTRIFEPLIGAVVAVVFPLVGRSLTSRRSYWTGIAGGLGLAGWTITVFVVDDSWGGFYTGGAVVLAAVTALMVVAAGSGRGPFVRLISYPALVGLGKISYGVYLWHWPILVALRQRGHVGALSDVLVVVATLVVSLVSYRVLEMPVRHSPLRPRVAIGVLAVVALGVSSVSAAAAGSGPVGGVTTEEAIAAMVAGPEIVAASGNAALSEVEVDAAPLSEFDVAAAPLVAVPMAPEVEDGPITVALIGDSTAWTLGGGELDFSVQHGSFLSPFDTSTVTLINMGRKGFRLIPGATTDAGGVRRRPPDDAENEAWWRSSIDEIKPDLVVALFGFNDLQSRDFDGRRVEFGTPEFDRLLIESARGLLDDLGGVAPVVWLTMPVLVADDIVNPALAVFARRYVVERTAYFNELVGEIAASDPAVSAIDFASWVCQRIADDRQPTCTLDADGQPIRSDGIHFTAAGAGLAAEWLTPQLIRVVRGP